MAITPYEAYDDELLAKEVEACEKTIDARLRDEFEGNNRVEIKLIKIRSESIRELLRRYSDQGWNARWSNMYSELYLDTFKPEPKPKFNVNVLGPIGLAVGTLVIIIYALCKP